MAGIRQCEQGNSLLFSLYSQPAFYSGYIVYAASLLIAPRKGIFGQQHGRVQVYEGESAQASSEMGSSGNGET